MKSRWKTGTMLSILLIGVCLLIVLFVKIAWNDDNSSNNPEKDFVEIYEDKDKIVSINVASICNYYDSIAKKDIVSVWVNTEFKIQSPGGGISLKHWYIDVEAQTYKVTDIYTYDIETRDIVET